MRALEYPDHVAAVVLCVCALSTTALAAAERPALPLPAPPQDEGLPYTRSAHRAAVARIGDHVAILPGSRYAWVYGKRTRLDDAELLRGEAFVRDGRTFVPEAFTALIRLRKAAIRADSVPADLAPLADRWVHTIERPRTRFPATIVSVDVGGRRWVAAEELARAFRRKVSRHPGGLLLIGDAEVDFSSWSETEGDCVVTMFDTPEKLADPDLATRYVPLLALQGKWTDHVRTTPDELALLDKPEPEWPMTPRERYDLTGFDAALLGSAVPPPGVHPRILFSPGDLPMLRERIARNATARKSMAEAEALLAKTWLDPESSDGRVFARLVSGDTDGLLPLDDEGRPRPGFHGTYRDQKPGIYSSHINYNAQCLATIALYALLKDDDELGGRAARAIAAYCRLGEPAVDAHLATSDSEWGVDHNRANNAATHWRGMHGVVPHMDLPFLLDFGGKWMTPGEKDLLRRVIAKATYGRRTGGGDGPRRCWRDINHVTWHLTHGLALTAIEGLEGFDAEAYASHAELTRDFLEWGIDRFGQAFEGNGKSGGGIQFQILSMIALARRGENLWGHPHWRRLLEAQVHCTAPAGGATVSSGTWGGGAFSPQAVGEIKAFYPGNRCADYLLTQAYPDIDPAEFDLAKHRGKLAGPKGLHRLRLPGPSYPGMAATLIYDSDWRVTKRDELALPLDWNDAVHGILSTASGPGPDAAWLCLHVRPNHYMGSGHHHSDIGMFYFSGEGVNWFTESPFVKSYDGRYHNLVWIDDISEPDGPPARGRYLGAAVGEGGAFAAADLAYAYSYRWCTQVMLWNDKWLTTRSTGDRGWELETDPEVLAYYQGTQRHKMRPWWPTYTFSNWIPTVRAPYNPVRRAFRTAGLVRGTHPYGVVIDDIKKDDEERLYQWTAMMGRGVWQARSHHLPGNQVLLASHEAERSHHAGSPYLRPRKGDPVLLVCALGLDEGDAPDGMKLVEGKTLEGPNDSPWFAQAFYDLLSVNVRAREARFRALLIPMKEGDPLPEIAWDGAATRATVEWADQRDALEFAAGPDGRTRLAVRRDGREIAGSR